LIFSEKTRSEPFASAGFPVLKTCLLLGLALFLVTACSPSAPGLRLSGGDKNLPPDRIIDLETGRILTLGDLVDRLSGVRVVFLGEVHSHAAQHRHQLEIIQGLHARDPRLAVALEVFARPRQDLLNRWVGGQLGEEDFKKEVQGKILDLDTFEVYFPLLQWARETRTPLLALNAPRSIVAKVAASGLDGLSEEERRAVAADLQFGPEAYRRRVAAVFSKHTVKDPDHFFAAQVVWDETMAETLAAYLTSSSGRDRRAVVICGNEHVIYGYGVPGRTARRLPAPQASLLMLLTSDTETLTPEAADFVWVTRPEPPRKRLRLGIELRTDPSGNIMVASVIPGSEAKRIGLRPGDELIKLNGRPLESLLDFHQAAVEGGADQDHILTVDRAGRILEFKFRFREQ